MRLESIPVITLAQWWAFVPGMRDRGFGSVIFIVFDSYWKPPGAHMFAYIAPKGALVGMTRTLAAVSAGTGSR